MFDEPGDLEGIELVDLELAEVKVELELIATVRSSVNVPESMCCGMVWPN